MKQRKPIQLYIIAFILLAVILAGEVVSLTSSHGDFSSSADIKGDSIEVNVSGKGAYTYDFIVMNGSLSSPTGVFVYYDEKYESAVEDVAVSPGARALDQEYYVQQMAPTLKLRGIENTKTLDAEGLQNLMSSEGIGKAVIFLSGSLPDTVYDGTSDSLILKWIDTGGRLYWCGNIIGKYISHTDSLESVPGGPSLFLGTDCSDSSSLGTSTIDNGFYDAFYFQNTELRYSPILDNLPEDIDYIAMGYTDGKQASITLLNHGEGLVGIIGGDYSRRQRIDLGQVIASGVCPGTEILEDLKGTMSYSVTKEVHSGERVYIILGGFFPVYCQMHEAK
ncbi:MAG: hypothetical protein IKQ67_02380 [Candidatus Methanomethylophilaceae archaeon]|nr:hypothetical protein [Candidatus Methanomethylophilaceae archaeon]